MTTFATMLKFLLRPSLTNAIVCSSTLHAGVLVASIAWLAAPKDKASMAGSTVVIHAQFASDLPRKQTVYVAAAPPAPATLNEPHVIEIKIDDSIAFENTQVAKQNAHDSGVLVAPLKAFDLDPVEANFPSESIRHSHQRRDETFEPRQVAEVAQIPREKIAAEPISAHAAIPQLAGTDDRSPPNFVGNPPPPYPRQAIRQRIEGVVTLRLHIANSGRVERVELAKSSGYSILDNSAVSTVRTWRGEPARVNGVPVETVEVLPVVFRLN